MPRFYDGSLLLLRKPACVGGVFHRLPSPHPLSLVVVRLSGAPPILLPPPHSAWNFRRGHLFSDFVVDICILIIAMLYIYLGMVDLCF